MILENSFTHVIMSKIVFLYKEASHTYIAIVTGRVQYLTCIRPEEIWQNHKASSGFSKSGASFLNRASFFKKDVESYDTRNFSYV